MKISLTFLFAITSILVIKAQDQRNFLNETPQEMAERMSWWLEAKYGMFIHFGLYSQLGGEWQGKTTPGYAEWIQASFDIPAQEYAMLVNTFNPKDFDADFIAKTAKEAGMKYIVITSKHHEGFCLWDSQHTNFDVASTPFNGRDILAELSVACQKHGLKFGTYYSIIDWHHGSQERNIDGPKNSERWSQIRMKTNRKAQYVEYMKNQIKELIDNYDTDILWFDGDWVYWWNTLDGDDLYNYVRNLKPSIIINNRVSKRPKFKKDFGTPEQKHPETSPNYYWEACYTLNTSWGYKIKDSQWKSPQVVYEKLMDINHKEGNLLLNIGPDGNGNVPEESVKILLEVGEMLRNQ